MSRPQDGRSLVRISTTWEGAGGIGGLFERLFAPPVMRGMYADELERSTPTLVHTAIPRLSGREPALTTAATPA